MVEKPGGAFNEYGSEGPPLVDISNTYQAPALDMQGTLEQLWPLITLPDSVVRLREKLARQRDGFACLHFSCGACGGK